MHDPHDFLRTLALVLGVAAITSVLFQRLRQPVVFGYMLAGLIVGPHVPIPLVADEPTVHTLSELGVILLMFSLGLEFSLRRLVAGGAGVLLVALLETSLMMWLGFSAGRLAGWTVLQSIYAGGAIAISSTTIILKAFAEQNVRGRFTELVFGVLIVEDMLAIVLLAVLAPAASGAAPLAVLGPTILRLGAFLAALLAGGMMVVPRLVRFVVRLDRPETTLVAAIGIAFGTALLARSIGYSVALGAFLAGSLVEESGEGATIAKRIEPVRDMLAAVFFVSVGMMIDPAMIARHWPMVLLFSALVLAGKVGAVTVSAFLTGHGTRTSVQAGMSLAQIGEFSFILAGLGLSTGATSPAFLPVLVAVSAITSLTTPGFIRAAEPLAAAIDRRLPRPLQTFATLHATWIEGLRSRPATGSDLALWRRTLRRLAVDAAIVLAIGIGAGVGTPPAAARLARATGWPSLACEAAAVAAAIALATPFVVGIGRTSRALGQLLARRAFAEPADGRLDPAAAPRRAMIVAVQSTAVLAVGAPLVALTQPFLPPLAGLLLLLAGLAALAVTMWRSASDLQGHVRAAAEAIVDAIGRHARQGGASEAERSLRRAYHLLPGLGEPEPVQLAAADAAVGRSLAELGLRGHTGATILAISRGDDVVLVPDGHERLREGDVVALAGTREAIDDARRVLTSGGPA